MNEPFDPQKRIGIPHPFDFKTHPVQSSSVTLGLLGILLLSVPNWPDEFTCCIAPRLGLGCVGLILAPLLSLAKKSFTALILCAAMAIPVEALNSEEPEPPPKQDACFWCWVGVGAAAVGGLIYIYVKAKRTCEKIKKKKDEQNKDDKDKDAQVSQAYRGCKNGTCAHLAEGVEILNERLHYEFQIVRGEINPDSFRIIPQSELMPWREWKEQLAEAGLPVTGDGTQQTYIVGNRISFDGEWVVIDNGGVPLYLEESEDLEHWRNTASFNVPENSVINFEDSNDGAVMFYRVVNGGAQ